MAHFADYKTGDKGPMITQLQNYLREVGYSIGNDGSYGPQTRAAVIHFQRARNVTDDTAGEAGPGTLVALAAARGAGWKQSGFSYSPSSASASSSSPAASAAPISLPLGLTPVKLGLIGLIGAAGWYFSKPGR